MNEQYTDTELVESVRECFARLDGLLPLPNRKEKLSLALRRRLLKARDLLADAVEQADEDSLQMKTETQIHFPPPESREQNGSEELRFRSLPAFEAWVKEGGWESTRAFEEEAGTTIEDLLGYWFSVEGGRVFVAENQ